MTTYYVSTNGNNGNSGTSEQSAWRTIQYAVTNSAVGPGDVIKVASGTYAENIVWNNKNGGRQGTAGKPIVLEALDLDNKPIVRGPAQYPRINPAMQMYISNRSHIAINGLAFMNYGMAGGLRVDCNGQDISDVTVQNCHFEGQNFSTSAATDRHCLHVYTWNTNRTSHSAKRIHILNCTFKDIVTGDKGSSSYNEVCTFQGRVIQSSMQNCTITNGSFIGFDMLGVYGGSGSNAKYYGWPESVIMRGNVVNSLQPDRNGNRNGIYLDRPKRRVLIEENRLVDLSKAIDINCEPYWNRDWNPGEHVIVRNNVTSGSKAIVDGVGANFGPESPDPSHYFNHVMVSHNVCYSKFSNGVPYVVGQARNAKVKNNVIRSEGSSSYNVRATYNAGRHTAGREFAGNMVSGSGSNYQIQRERNFSSHGAFQAAGYNRSGFVGTPRVPKSELNRFS